MREMKTITIITVLTAISVPAVINMFLVYAFVSTLSLSGAAAAMGDVDFYFNLFIFGPFTIILSVAGFLMSSHARTENQRPCRIGFAVNAGLPFLLYAVFKMTW